MFAFKQNSPRILLLDLPENSRNYRGGFRLLFNGPTLYHIIYNATLVMAAVSATILTFAIIVFLCTKKFSESTSCHFYGISRNQDNQWSSNLPKMCLNIREPLKGGMRFYKSQRIYYYYYF